MKLKITELLLYHTDVTCADSERAAAVLCRLSFSSCQAIKLHERKDVFMYALRDAHILYLLISAVIRQLTEKKITLFVCCVANVVADKAHINTTL